MDITVLCLIAAIVALVVYVIILNSSKAALKATLAAQEISHRQLEEQRDKDAAARAEQQEKDLANMKDAFKALAAENSEAFGRQSAETIDRLLKPIQDKFTTFDQTVRASQEKSAEQNASMKTLIEQVMKHSQTVGDEAKNLANALTGYSKVQGDFGEMLLTDVLKNSGLVEGIHFFTQSVMTDEFGHEIKSESGATMIPDVIVLYPDDTIVIVDSKVSLNAYKDYINSESVEDRKKFAKEHVRRISAHVDELKRKDYASYVPEGKSKVDYNIMFIPMEGAFRLMLEEEPGLWQVAKNNNVLIVSQMTLVIVLNMIQMSWKQHNQEKNIAEVYKTAGELMSQLQGWMESYVKIGESIGKASDAYEEARRKLSDSNQSVIKKIEKLEKIGVGTRKSNARIKAGGRMTMEKESIIPKSLLNDSEQE